MGCLVFFEVSAALFGSVFFAYKEVGKERRGNCEMK